MGIEVKSLTLSESNQGEELMENKRVNPCIYCEVGWGLYSTTSCKDSCHYYQAHIELEQAGQFFIGEEDESES